MFSDLRNIAGFGVFMLVLIFLLSFFIGGSLWTYSLNTIADRVDSPAHFEFWQGGLIGLIPYIGQCSIPVAIIVYIFVKIFPEEPDLEPISQP